MIIKSYELGNKITHLEQHVYLFYGENKGLKDDLKNHTINFIKTKKEVEIVNFNEDQLLKLNESYYNAVQTGSLFSKTKIIIINFATNKSFDFVNFLLEKNISDVNLMLISNILEKKSKLRQLGEKSTDIICVPCYYDTQKSLNIIINNALRENKINISSESVNLLIENSGGDRHNLKNELEKISAYAKNRKTVSFEEVKRLVNSQENLEIDEITTNCLCGNLIKFKRSLNFISFGNINHIVLIKILSRKIEKLIQYQAAQKNYPNIDSLINSIKPPIFWKEKPNVKKQLEIWKDKNLNELVEEINIIEEKYKKHYDVSKIILNDFIVKLCKRANNYSL